MQVDNDYLPFLFEGDYIYLVKEDSNVPAYQSSLREDSSQAEEPTTKIAATPTLKEEISKPVLILVDDEFTDTEQDTLLKLLTAIQVKEQHFQLIKDHPADIKSLKNLKLFLSFHKDFVKDDKYQIHQMNTTRVIYTHNLNELNRDSKKKLQLWNLLKTTLR